MLNFPIHFYGKGSTDIKVFVLDWSSRSYRAAHLYSAKGTTSGPGADTFDNSNNRRWTNSCQSLYEVSGFELILD